MKLKDKAIVVTGASSGMGKAIVELFVKEGANVVAVARRADRLASLAESLKGEAGKCIPFTGDVSRREDTAQTGSPTQAAALLGTYLDARTAKL